MDYYYCDIFQKYEVIVSVIAKKLYIDFKQDIKKTNIMLIILLDATFKVVFLI